MRLTGEVWYDCITHKSTINVINSGVATGGQGEQSATPDSEKFAKNRKKEEKIRKYREKRGRIGKKRKKSGTFFHFAPPDRQGWLPSY